MEINEIIINEDPQIKSLSQEELILYNYLNNENKIKIKSDLASQISALKQIKETSPKVDENNKKNENLKPENERKKVDTGLFRQIYCSSSFPDFEDIN